MTEYSFEQSELLKDRIRWRPYGALAFDEAVDAKKPIFLLLTAPSWCYWCQVYESEDYLFHPEVVDVINNSFIPIYVDADQRQDITRQYLEGGWPSTTILTPDRHRILGYSGPRPVPQMLLNLQYAVNHVAGQKKTISHQHSYSQKPFKIPTAQQLEEIPSQFAHYILTMHDHHYGGFGTGQKFPQGRTLDFALEWYQITNDKRFLTLVITTLNHQYTKKSELQSHYNLFDPIEGGFHRYGTTREWTPPHYEKMLYDNARLLKAYFHLSQIVPDNAIAQEVVTKTRGYIEREWYDGTAFFGNTDVAGEQHYYGKSIRPTPKARVEPTKYTDWNADILLTYLSITAATKDSDALQIINNGLQFFQNEMITTTGVHHFATIDARGVRGNLSDNALLLLAYVEAYEVLSTPDYKKIAVHLANICMNTLYDWYSGGFFERNSPDIDHYPQGEYIRLEKPVEENGIMSFALLKLYIHTKEEQYLHAGLTTLAQWDLQGLDTHYYFVKAAQFTNNNNLLDEYAKKRTQMDALRHEALEHFWLAPILDRDR